VLCVHLKKADSMLSEESLAKAVSYHQENPVFMRRPVTTFFINHLASLSGLSTGMSFVLINFFFLFLNGFLVFCLSGLFSQNTRSKLLHTLLYFVNAAVLFAFYQPVYSYDEPVQYFFLFLSLIAVQKNKLPQFGLFFLLALITRETSLLAMPGMAYLIYLKNKQGRLKWMALAILPVALYIPYILLFVKFLGIAETTKADSLSRLSDFRFNFSDAAHSMESFFAIVMVLGPSLYFYFRSRTKIPSSLNAPATAFFITLALNTAAILLTAKAREFRLFALPLCFLWPVFTTAFAEQLGALSFGNISAALKKPPRLGSLILLIAAGYLVAFKLYGTTIGNPGDNYFNEYLFALLLLLALHWCARPYKTKRPG
jgi:hypothetical protein